MLLVQSSTAYHSLSQRDNRAITLYIIEVAEPRMRYGCQRIHPQLQLEGINLRRHVSAAHRQLRPGLTHIDQCLSMDFVSDSLIIGRRFRALAVVDNFSQECLAIHAG